MANEEKRVADILFDFIFGNNLILVKFVLPLINLNVTKIRSFISNFILVET